MRMGCFFDVGFGVSESGTCAAPGCSGWYACDRDSDMSMAMLVSQREGMVDSSAGWAEVAVSVEGVSVERAHLSAASTGWARPAGAPRPRMNGGTEEWDRHPSEFPAGTLGDREDDGARSQSIVQRGGSAAAAAAAAGENPGIMQPTVGYGSADPPTYLICTRSASLGNLPLLGQLHPWLRI